MSQFFLLTSPSWGPSGFTRVRLDTFVSGSSLWALLRPLYFHQAFQASRRLLEAPRHPYCSLPRRRFWVAPSFQAALDHSTKVKSDLVHSGFVPNSVKSIWVPTLVIDWLGFTIDLFQGLLFIPGKKIQRVLSDINSILEANCSSARELSALAGRINSFILAVGNATTLMTKFLHMSIVLQSSLDSKFPLPPSVKEELLFWKENVRCLNGRPIGQQFSGSRTIVYSDASDVGAGGGVIKGHDGVICHFPWSPDEAGRSST